jgi:hypothetical protein
VQRLAIWIFKYDVRKEITKLCDSPLYRQYFFDREHGEQLRDEILARYQCLLIEIIKFAALAEVDEVEKTYELSRPECMLAILASVVSDVGKSCIRGEKIEIYGEDQKVIKIVQFTRGG